MDTDGTGTTETGQVEGAETGTEGAQVESGATGEGQPEGDPAALGDAGKQALDRMKAERKAARDEAKALRAELEALKAPKPAEGQPDVEAIKREATAQATKVANERILNAEIRAAAAGKLADPADALRLLDLSEFDVGSDGSVDTADIKSAIDGLLQSKPYLSAQGGTRFQGSADGGARKGTREGAQLTRDDLKSMTPEAIMKAKADGRLADLGYK